MTEYTSPIARQLVALPFTPTSYTVHGPHSTVHRNTAESAARAVVMMGRRTATGRAPGRIVKLRTVGTDVIVSAR